MSDFLVVCMGVGQHPSVPVSPLVKGCVYTVIGVVDGMVYDGPAKGYILAEVPTPHGIKGFNARLFRPVRKTDISVFTALLNPAPTKVEA